MLFRKRVVARIPAWFGMNEVKKKCVNFRYSAEVKSLFNQLGVHPLVVELDQIGKLNSTVIWVRMICVGSWISKLIHLGFKLLFRTRCSRANCHSKVFIIPV